MTEIPDLKVVSPELLLRTFASLTHIIHETVNVKKVEELRAQRDLVKAELLRRMEEV